MVAMIIRSLYINSPYSLIGKYQMGLWFANLQVAVGFWSNFPPYSAFYKILRNHSIFRNL